jgi:hypothetical protein
MTIVVIDHVDRTPIGELGLKNPEPLALSPAPFSARLIS